MCDLSKNCWEISWISQGDTVCSCLHDRKFLASQASKESYLLLLLQLDILFIVSLKFNQSDEEVCYVVLRTSIWFQGHLYDIDSLEFTTDFGGILWQPFYPLLTKEPKDFFSLQIKKLHSQVQNSALSDIL